jgi:hypothetical protein
MAHALTATATRIPHGFGAYILYYPRVRSIMTMAFVLAIITSAYREGCGWVALAEVKTSRFFI